MLSKKSGFRLRFVTVAVAAIVFAIGVYGQDDPDPNSPTPILLSEMNSTRALAQQSARQMRGRLAQSGQGAFAPNTKITLYGSNIPLMEGEGASAFRIEVEDAKGRRYRFPVLNVQPIKSDDGLFAFTVLLRDEIGYWEPPTADGDLLIALTWRGLTSNRVRLGYGKVGGDIKDDPGAVPTPRGTLPPAQKSLLADEGPATDFVAYPFVADRKRFMEQASFGPTAALDQRIRRIGLRTWLADQFTTPYPSVNNPYPDIALRSTNPDDSTLGCGPAPNPSTPEYRACIRTYYSMYPVQKWFYTEALYGDAQLRHRVAWALAQLWVISSVDIQQSSWMIAYHKILSQNAFGNFRTLMKEMTLNPGMGDYLDMVRSTKNNPNENYAREIMQLFTVGLFMLNQNGTLKLDGSGNPIPTYTQDTVNNLTKVLTGWTFCNTTCANSAPGILNYKDPLILNQNNHDVTAKTLLAYPNAVNQNIPAGLNGSTEIDLALDNIFYHPNVGPFVGKYLIQQLVTSNPTPAYVSRVAGVFNNNGAGVRGDLKAVVKAILLDPEARGDAKTDPNYGKLREPVQFVTNIARRMDVKNVTLNGPSDGVINSYSNGIGQNTFGSPTVFNFYPPGYIIPNTSLPGPEFALMTTSTSVGRANLGYSMVYNQIGTAEDRPAGTKLDFTELQSIAAADPTGNQLMDVLNQRMLHGTMSSQMRSSILTAFTSIASTNPLARAQQAVYLVVTSSQYQIQR